MIGAELMALSKRVDLVAKGVGDLGDLVRALECRLAKLEAPPTSAGLGWLERLRGEGVDAVRAAMRAEIARR